jgi:RNA polymerase sigma-70 factor (ECF subfamily)
MSQRTNQEWLQDLRSECRRAAVADLHAVLVGGLSSGLGGRTDLDEATIEDLAQDALLKILDALDSFRGESHFTTWARKIAINTALTELRRRRWRDVSLDEIAELAGTELAFLTLADPEAATEKQATQRVLVGVLGQIVATELTDRQRTALVAAYVHAVPLEQLAKRMGTSRNALYKLLHDARQRIKGRIMMQGLSPEDFLEAFGT